MLKFIFEIRLFFYIKMSPSGAHRILDKKYMRGVGGPIGTIMQYQFVFVKYQ